MDRDAMLFLTVSISVVEVNSKSLDIVDFTKKVINGADGDSDSSEKEVRGPQLLNAYKLAL